MKSINNYKLYKAEPNTIDPNARVYFKTFYFDTNNVFKNRLVRVYIPSTYDFSNPNKRFPVLYMLDGKNLFDDYTSFVGEWGIDETIESFIKDKKSDGVIVVGIDAPNNDLDRSMEMTPPGIRHVKGYFTNEDGYADVLAKFIFNIVKPDIDKTFFTLPDKENTGVGGSSMGGLMSFYLGCLYPSKIKYCLNFSSAFFLFDEKELEKKILLKYISKKLPRMYFYVGGVGFEAEFVKPVKWVYEYMLAHGYSSDDIKLLIDESKEHNEKAWREYFGEAFLAVI